MLEMLKINKSEKQLNKHKNLSEIILNQIRSFRELRQVDLGSRVQ